MRATNNLCICQREKLNQRKANMTFFASVSERKECNLGVERSQPFKHKLKQNFRSIFKFLKLCKINEIHTSTLFCNTDGFAINFYFALPHLIASFRSHIRKYQQWVAVSNIHAPRLFHFQWHITSACYVIWKYDIHDLNQKFSGYSEFSR